MVTCRILSLVPKVNTNDFPIVGKYGRWCYNVKTHIIISSEIISLDDNVSLYECVLPNMRFPCTHAKGEVIKHLKLDAGHCSLSNEERELLKHVFTHGT